MQEDFEETQIDESQEEYVEDAQEQSEATPNSADRNWEEFRSVAKAQKMEIETQREQIERLTKQLEEIQKPKEPEPDEWDGYDPDDYAKVEHVKKSSSEVKKLKEQLASLQAKLNQAEIQRQENETRAKHQDYDYVIDEFGIPMIKKNPALRQALKAMPNWAEMAYEMAKATPEYKEAMQGKTSPAADKVLKNAKRPTSVNAASSSVKQKVDAFSTMSPAEIWAKSQEYARRA